MIDKVIIMTFPTENNFEQQTLLDTMTKYRKDAGYYKLYEQGRKQEYIQEKDEKVT